MIDLYGVFLVSRGAHAVFTGISSVLTLWLLYRMFTRLRRARWVEDTPTSKIRSAAQGLVELVGQVEAGGHAPLLSPLSGRPCLWYRFTVEELQRRGRNTEWRTVERGSSDRPFLLGDGTGTCWVQPAAAEVHPRQRRRWEGNRRWPLGHKTQTGVLGALLGRRYRYTEEWLHEGDQLYALGWFESRGGGREAMDAQSIARQIISRWKADYPDLLARFDRNGDGQLDQAEWEGVRVAAAREAQQQIRSAGEAPALHLLVKPPHKGLPFLLSDHHEEQLSQRLRRQSGWSLAGMLLAGGVAAWLWLALLH
ncbi:GIDE domain-containing protein [Halopseudomonas bauzanensis]|uniref:GIDE domain-containing protein n=1 Tax=Halopseudomonas bauzanensis TaxID=653930 RepID=UPI002554C8A0|nr:GIDE domain-containing protein [Halopseudomonas bauzanensis]